AIAPIFVTYLMIHYGWRSSFWASAILGLIVGAVWFVFARDIPEEHPRVSKAELSYIQKFRTTNSDSTSDASFSVGWTQIIGNRSVLAVTASYFCFGYVAWIFFSWFYIYLAKVRGLDLKTSSYYSTLPPIAIVISSLVRGTITYCVTSAYAKRTRLCAVACVALLMAAII